MDRVITQPKSQEDADHTSDRSKSIIPLHQARSTRASESTIRVDSSIMRQLGAGVSITIVNAEGDLLEFNSAFVNSVDCPADLVPNISVRSLCGYDEEAFQRRIVLYHNAFDHFGRRNDIFEAATKHFYTMKGDVRYCYGLYKPIYNDNGEPVAILAFSILVDEPTSYPTVYPKRIAQSPPIDRPDPTEGRSHVPPRGKRGRKSSHASYYRNYKIPKAMGISFGVFDANSGGDGDQMEPSGSEKATVVDAGAYKFRPIGEISRNRSLECGSEWGVN
eukprot:TRINITY_DN5210_c0_g1_i1.p1 TRINITY_DN5210_c0_g1~~TRINITY_DN5210_c0_g1_i1.p1  ORF type:complete len:276 (+),score=54.97 TRINITY_DN5210_c0_g1_i1:38-865(+)